MWTLAPGIAYLDLNFDGRAGAIASAVLHGPGGVAIVDPGPSSTLPTLRRALALAGISLADVTDLLLTHIHLDHAGAAGTLVAERPGLRVWVHARGAPHLVDPRKLVASAARLYGDAMDRLWGDVRPVPADALVVLSGGERRAAGGRVWDVAYTPGHAAHHVSFLDADSGVAFVGDVAGMHFGGRGPALPPTPPPDIDLAAWRESLTRIDAWNAQTLFLTHFGPAHHPRAHLAGLAEELTYAAALAKRALDRDEEDAARQAWFVAELRRHVRKDMGEDVARICDVAGRFDLSWLGLSRYWRTRHVPERP